MNSSSLASLLLACALVPQAGPAGELEKVHALVKTSPGEARWDEIPWMTSLWDARRKAAAEGKPLFIWAANGNPLGVT
jgi:hypothetical protein